MRRVLRLGCFTLIVMGLCSRPAEAGLWDWLEELSGPGPFREDALANFTARVCFTPTPRSGSREPCVYLDYRRFINNEDDNFFEEIGEVRATAFDFGLTWEIWRPIDVGVGGGFLRFHTSKKDTTRTTLVGPRVQVKPLLFFRPAPYWSQDQNLRRRQWASVLKFYVRHSVILGRLQGTTDFGAEKSSFDVTNDRVMSYGFLLDFTELIYR
jgi:hypothetical protein